jgi:hypothetical protein
MDEMIKQQPSKESLIAAVGHLKTKFASEGAPHYPKKCEDLIEKLNQMIEEIYTRVEQVLKPMVESLPLTRYQRDEIIRPHFSEVWMSFMSCFIERYCSEP